MKHLDYNKRFDELRSMKPVSQDERYKLKVTDLQEGSFIKLNNKTYKVTDEFVYRYKKDRWTELQLMCVEDESIIYIEIEVDDEVEIYLTETELKLREIGVSKSDLEELVDEEGSIKYGGIKYWYEDDYKVKFSRASDEDNTEDVYIYEFESDNDEYLTIEEWDGSYEVFLSTELNKKRLEIVNI
jgi:hypothetical protein